MVTHREIVEHAALCAARCRTVTLLIAVAALAIGIAAVACLLRPQPDLMVGLISAATFAAALIHGRLRRINRRLEEIEKYL